MSKLVGIVSGSASDKPVVDKITSVLDELGVAWEYSVLSAHRTPNKVARYSKEAEGKGLEVLIGVAGLSAALPGCLAAHSTLPVIGVPCDGGALGGADALYSVAQMPPGIPVAAVGIGNGKNAAYLAASILSISHPNIKEKLQAYRKSLGDE
ncbi:MAG: 5-(carboxyamino)imidazole ribonucleotide mutase [Candidatus Fibromonas sp.]|jgi:5-(carboxyamino)imidazole ribonucleotide mutase|nr:5-(carboxyamino)imidazole ribonucleotide mutase [Candidatus Fibromonas sp.]